MATALVTGANRGIGLQLARLLKERGDEVIAVVRRSSPELDALGVRVEAGVDVTSDDAVRALAGRVQAGSVDLLVLNAGVLRRGGLDDLDLALVHEQLEVNAVAPLRLAHALRSALKDGGKVAIVTSRMGSIADNSSGGMYGYRMSKAAVNMVGATLAVDLKPRGISVCLLHPGYVRTEMTSGRGNVEPAEAAAGLLARIDELSPETSGGFFHASGERLPW